MTEDEYEAKPDSIQIIEENIKVELEKAGVFHLFVIWENLVKKSASKTVFEISSIIKSDEYWESNIRHIFQRMGIARAGLNKTEESNLLKASILTLVQSFTDQLETDIKQVDLPEYISLKTTCLIKESKGENTYELVMSVNESGKNIYGLRKNKSNLLGKSSIEGLIKSANSNIQDEHEKNLVLSMLFLYKDAPSKLNTSLHLEKSPSQENMPGNLYEKIVNQPERRKELLQTYIYFDIWDKDIVKRKIVNPDELLVKCKFIELEVSPICDWAQGKWKKSRWISGIMYPAEVSLKYIKNHNHFYSVAPEFSIDGKVWRLIFDCHLFKSLDHSQVKRRKVGYRLKRDLLLDIIAKISSHINRPGVSFIQ